MHPPLRLHPFIFIYAYINRIYQRQFIYTSTTNGSGTWMYMYVYIYIYICLMVCTKFVRGILFGRLPINMSRIIGDGH